jgi:hypothetical protein
LNENRDSRVDAPARKAAGLGICLMVIAGLAACGSSAQSGGSQQPTASPSAAVAGPAASLDPASYANDISGYGTVGIMPSDIEYTQRYEGLDGLDHMAEACAILEAGLPKAIDLNKVEARTPRTQTAALGIFWQPSGRRDTLLPPGGHGERIYEVEVELAEYVRGGDAVAQIWFLSRAEGDALGQDSLATPQVYPNQAYSFALDKETAAALLDLFWVKGEPAAS